MVKDSASEGVLRPLDLDPERARRDRSRALRDRRHRLEFGAARRLRPARPRAAAALQREVAVPARRRPGRRPARSPPDGFRRTVEAVRRFRAIADAMGVAKIDVTGTEAIRRASNGPALAAAIAAEIRPRGSHPQRRRGGALRHARRDLRLLPPGRDGRRHGRRQPRSRRGARRPGRRSLGQPAARRAAGRGDARRRARRGQAPDRRRCCATSLPPALGQPVFYPVGGGWRALAKAHMEAVDAPVKVVHGYTLDDRGGARLRQVARRG